MQPWVLWVSAPRDQSEWVGPGLLGFVVIAALGVATFLLWRNMNKQLRKVRFDAKDGDRPGAGAPGGGTGSAPPTEGDRAPGGDAGEDAGGARHPDDRPPATSEGPESGTPPR